MFSSPCFQDSPEELGYVSDVCDYNVQTFPRSSDPKLAGSELGAPAESPGAGVVHGLLSLSIAQDDRAIKVDKTTNQVVKKSPVKERKAYSDIEQMEPPYSAQTFNIVKPFPGDGKQKLSEEEPDSLSQYSRQSSVEDSKADGKGKRKSSGGKSSAIKSKIQMRKMMKEANRMDRASGTLSDDYDHDNGNDSVEEKQDSEPIVDDEIRNTNKTLKPQHEHDVSQLTPETERRMKDWNSRFSNLKHSFDPSDREDDPSRLVIQSMITIFFNLEKYFTFTFNY